MMKKYKFWLLALSVVITMSNCNKNKLDLVNPNEQTAASFWQTSDEALQGANACYEAVINDGGYMRQTQAILDIRGEDVRSLSPWNNLSNIGVFNTSSFDPCDVWTYIYPSTGEYHVVIRYWNMYPILIWIRT
jgi:hypothetical protein